QGDQALGGAAQVDEYLPAEAIRDQAAGDPKWNRGDEHDRQPVRCELISVANVHHVVEEGREEVGDDGDCGGDHEACEDHPREVAFVEWGDEAPYCLHRGCAGPPPHASHTLTTRSD